MAKGTEAPRLAIGTTDAGSPFSLPAQLLATGRACVLGASGSGKSYTVGVLCEELCKTDVPFCLIDLEGEYWGIKDRFEAIWVGDRDLCDARWGEVDLDRLVRAAPNAPPLILDYSRVDNQPKAVLDFLGRLWKASADARSPYLIIVDEADRVVPRGGPRMEALFEIAVRGRKRGLGLVLCTQRPSQVDPDIIGQCTVQLVGKLTLDVDLRAVGPFFGREKAEGLAQLERGRFWVLGAGEPGGELVRVRPRETSHKSETPELTINRLARPSEEVLRSIRGDSSTGRPPGSDERSPGAPVRPEPPRPSLRTGLAVLPFDNISPDPNDAYFADGLTEEMITVLSRIPRLLLIARTSVMQYKSTTKPVSQIGTELGVSSILEGSVRKVGNRLRITAQLIDVASQGHVWAVTYDRDLDDVFAVQADIARQVAEALKIELRVPESARIDARPTIRPESYLAYLKGRTILHSLAKDSLKAAKAQFERAIEVDPANAAAYSGLADVYNGIGGEVTDSERPQADEAARRCTARALEMDPNLSEAHASLGMILLDNLDYAGAEREYKLALALNPSYSLAHDGYAHLLEDEGRADEALVEVSLAEAADPLSAVYAGHSARLLIWAGRFEEALAELEKLAELAPDTMEYYTVRALYHRARSDLGAFAQDIDRLEELEEDPALKQIWRGWGYIWSGQQEKARAMLRDLEALPGYSHQLWAVAFGYAELGELDECFRVLTKAVQSHLMIGFLPFRLDPKFEPVRSDPRFQTLLKEMNIP
ncbi:MAG TPA: DUF87 domain-containing protein [Thermoplasmata archaeon]|nr:DUF87 domain-containing protein [Thermoplasmata archaeon]